MELQRSLWHHPDMIVFRALANDHPDLRHSPLLRGALLTLQYTQKHGSIGLTKTKAFKRLRSLGRRAFQLAGQKHRRDVPLQQGD